MVLETLKEYFRSQTSIYNKKDNLPKSKEIESTLETHSSVEVVPIHSQPSEILLRAEELEKELTLISKENIDNPPEFTFHKTTEESPYLGSEFTEDVEIITDAYEGELEEMYRRVRKNAEDH